MNRDTVTRWLLNSIASNPSLVRPNTTRGLLDIDVWTQQQSKAALSTLLCNQSLIDHEGQEVALSKALSFEYRDVWCFKQDSSIWFVSVMPAPTLNVAMAKMGCDQTSTKNPYSWVTTTANPRAKAFISKRNLWVLPIDANDGLLPYQVSLAGNGLIVEGLPKRSPARKFLNGLGAIQKLIPELWIVPSSHIAEAGGLLNLGLYVDPAVGPLIHKLRAGAIEARDASFALDADLQIDGLSVELRGYQRAGISFVEKNAEKGGVIIGDDMGTGKTVTSFAAAMHLGHKRTLIVCPSIVKANWENEINQFVATPQNIFTLKGRTKQTIPSDTSWAIINYDILDARKPCIAEWGPTCFIFDESHNIKNPKAKRTKTAIELVAAARKESPQALTLCLSGTAQVNRPLDLLPQLEVTGRLPDFGGKKMFQDTYWDSMLQKPTNTQRLAETLRTTGTMIRRLKEDVLPELPAYQIIKLPLDVDAKRFKEYKEAEQDFLNWVMDNALKKGMSSEEARKSALRAKRAEALVKLMALRKLSAKCKHHAAMEALDGLLGNDHPRPTLIFAHHQEVLEEAAAHLNCPAIYGKTPVKAREQYISDFQNGQLNALVLGITAAGIGINLTRASEIMMLELPWTWKDFSQAFSRAVRMGQKNKVTVWIANSSKTIDQRLTGIVLAKRRLHEEVLDAKADDDESEESVIETMIDSLWD